MKEREKEIKEERKPRKEIVTKDTLKMTLL